jgi:TROVE domain-containing protein
MVKFGRKKKPANVTAPVRSVSDVADTWTAAGGAGFGRDAKSELFLFALTNMVSEGTFYESARDRDRRFASLIRTVASEDPAWIATFVPFLRDTMQMRSASVVLAAEFAAVRRETDGADPKKGAPTTRSVIASALSRADEPAEMLAYWHQAHGRRVPPPVKRGIADAARRLYTERAALKYDGLSRAYRMGDVIELAHPDPVDDAQSALFKLLLDRRHGREDVSVDAERLPVIAARAELEAIPLDDRRAVLSAGDVGERFARAGVTWEWLAGWLNGPMDARAWEVVIPSMGYMALLRNLRNFDDAGISKRTRHAVEAKLSDPAEVARSRQLPLRFLSAWNHVATMGWGPTLERAMGLSLANVPALPRKTLVMVDVSGSMTSPLSGRSHAQRWQVAAVFGAALATRAADGDLVAFNDKAHAIKVRRGASILRTVDDVRRKVGGGTQTWASVRSSFKDHDRIVILTDEQAYFDAEHAQAGASEYRVPIYTFNLAGYRAGHAPSGSHGRYTFGGLTDQAFAAIEILERGHDLDWDGLFGLPRKTATDADVSADPDDDPTGFAS